MIFSLFASTAIFDLLTLFPTLVRIYAEKWVDLLVGNLGMKVLRHEEFNQGCEATCNGPYSRPWSKTMIGFGSELDHFVFELTYNYGIRSYEKGNDLRFVKLAVPDSWEPPTELPFTLSNGTYILNGYDHVEWHVTKGHKTAFVEHVSINVANIDKAKSFYQNVATLTLTGETADSATLSWRAKDLTKLQLVQLPEGAQVNHGTAFGRIAFTCPAVEPVEARVKASQTVIKHGPVKLDTPGKATVEVLIIEDVDGYEICFVEATGFDELSKPVEGADKIDWATRSEYGADTF